MSQSALFRMLAASAVLLSGCAGQRAAAFREHAETTHVHALEACAGHKVPHQEGVMIGKLLRRVQPDPPPGFEPSGFACVAATIYEDGHLSDFEIVETNNLAFAKAFVNALGRWRYEPAMKEGKPARLRTLLSAAFNRR